MYSLAIYMYKNVTMNALTIAQRSVKAGHWVILKLWKHWRKVLCVLLSDLKTIHLEQQNRDYSILWKFNSIRDYFLNVAISVLISIYIFKTKCMDIYNLVLSNFMKIQNRNLKIKKLRQYHLGIRLLRILKTWLHNIKYMCVILKFNGQVFMSDTNDWLI